MKIIEKIIAIRSTRQFRKECDKGLEMLDEFFAELKAK